MTEHNWREHAACVGTGDLMFPIGNRTREDREQIATARAICGTCPVIDECRAYARKHDVSGVWAGVFRAYKDGRRLQRDATTGRSRESAIEAYLPTVRVSGVVSPRRTDDEAVDRLTRQGLSAGEIAVQLGTTPRTVTRARQRNAAKGEAS